MKTVQDQSPCPICGETRYSWGEVTAQGMSYYGEDEPWISRGLKIRYKMPARHCDNCGNVQLFSRRLDSNTANE